jgi:L-ornithine Nalpha-acyltransferase
MDTKPMDVHLQSLDPQGLEERQSRGHYRVRFAQTPEEILTAQRLRYSVFYEEMSAVASPAMRASGLDSDRFDDACDHLIVVKDHERQSKGRFALHDGDMVGTYRLLPQDKAWTCGGFYTQGEFDVAALLRKNPGKAFLELGRSCVLQQHRTRAIIDQLWQGIWNYVRLNRIDVMFGCASFPGADPAQHAGILNYLAVNHAPPEEWRARALPHRHVEMKSDKAGKLDARAAVKAIPPLIKGYLRLGCFIGDGAVVDTPFNTTDVLIILPVERINPRYFAHFGQPNGVSG